MFYVHNFTKPLQYMKFKLIKNYAELSETFAAVTNTAHLFYQLK